LRKIEGVFNRLAIKSTAVLGATTAKISADGIVSQNTKNTPDLSSSPRELSRGSFCFCDETIAAKNQKKMLIAQS
jgi:hypothetical protein